MERQREEPQRRKEAEESGRTQEPAQEAIAARPSPSPSASSIRRAAAVGPALWALPSSGGGVWPVWEDARLDAIAKGLEAAPPLIQTADAANSEHVIASSSESTDRALRDKVQNAAYAFIQRLVICGALFIAGFAAWKLPGALKFLDTIFIGGSIGYFLYVIGRYGFGALRWHNWRVDASQAFNRGRLESSKLCERFAQALKLRATLSEEERGRHPDDELLDTNAYRKLIQEGETTPEELSRLGRAIDEQLGLRDPARKDRKLSEVAAELGIDVGTALFYADVANAASEIRIEYHVKEVFGE